MALITRLSRLFHADVNAVLDQLEEPELLLKQAIREMEENLEQQKKHLKLLTIEQQHNNKYQQELTETVNELTQQISLCFNNDKEALAKKLIRRKLESQHCVDQLTKNSTFLDDQCTELRALLEQHYDQLKSMQQRAAIFNSHSTSGPVNLTSNIPSFSVREEDVDVAFLDEKQKWSQS